MSNVDDSRARPSLGSGPSFSRMDAERWRRVEDVLDAALACEPYEWDAVLTARCGDDAELRREVEKYLARVSAAEKFLVTPPSAVAALLVADGQDVASGNRSTPVRSMKSVTAPAITNTARPMPNAGSTEPPLVAA